MSVSRLLMVDDILAFCDTNQELKLGFYVV